MKRMPVSLYKRWVAFYNVSPFGDERGDFQAAMISFTMASMWSGKGSSPSFEEYLLPFGGNKRQKRQSWQQMRDMCKAAARAHGKKQPDPMGPLTEKTDG